MKKLMLVYCLIGGAGLSFANTRFFEILGKHPVMKAVERSANAERFYLFSFERSRIQPRCPGCMYVDVAFRNQGGLERHYQASVTCPPRPGVPLETVSCRVDVLER